MKQKALRRRRPYPYYKVQVLDARIRSWIDERQVFADVATARQYIEQELASREARIMVIYRDHRHPLEG